MLYCAGNAAGGQGGQRGQGRLRQPPFVLGSYLLKQITEKGDRRAGCHLQAQPCALLCPFFDGNTSK